GDAGRLRLLALARVDREVGVDRVLGADRRRGGDAGRLTRTDPGLAPGGSAGHPGLTDPGGKPGVTGSDVLARPRRERGALGADLGAHLPGAPLDLVVLEHVEVDHHAHHAGAELRVADVLDAAAILAIVQHGGRREPGALQIDHQAGRTGQRELLHLDRALAVDHDLHAARRGERAAGP